MNVSRFIPGAVLGSAATAAVAAFALVVSDAEAPYADLVPAPDTIIWEQGQESTVLVSTNLDDVDLRIDSVAMGISNVQGAVPHSGELMVLGASVGCQDWAVSKLTASNIVSDRYDLAGNVDRDNFTGTAEVFVRSRRPGEPWPTSPFRIDVAGPTGGSFLEGFNVSEGKWELEASSDDGFPIALTRFITIDTTAGTATTDEEVESIVLIKDTGVALKACSEHDDLTLTLHGDDRELNRYVVDIGPEPTATPVPTPLPGPPSFSPAYRTLRFCPDAKTPRSAILTGSEAVGTTAATGTGTITYAMAPDGDSRDFAFFTIDSSTGAITVSDAGADDHTGIDGTRLYTFVVLATDDAGRTGEALVAVQLDLSTDSPNDDGLCS